MFVETRTFVCVSVVGISYEYCVVIHVVYFLSQLRQSVFQFVQKELAPKAEEIDRTNSFPEMKVPLTLTAFMTAQNQELTRATNSQELMCEQRDDFSRWWCLGSVEFTSRGASAVFWHQSRKVGSEVIACRTQSGTGHDSKA